MGALADNSPEEEEGSAYTESTNQGPASRKAFPLFCSVLLERVIRERERQTESSHRYTSKQTLMQNGCDVHTQTTVQHHTVSWLYHRQTLGHLLDSNADQLSRFLSVQTSKLYFHDHTDSYSHTNIFISHIQTWSLHPDQRYILHSKHSRSMQ